MTFREKVEEQLKTPYDVVMVMVEALKEPTTEVFMESFGFVKKGKCFGCAATNVICRIGGYTAEDLKRSATGEVVYSFTEEINDSCVVDRGELTGGCFVGDFEEAFDFLRIGEIDHYNTRVQENDLPMPEIVEPDWWSEDNCMNNHNYLELLPVFERLAMEQEGAPIPAAE